MYLSDPQRQTYREIMIEPFIGKREGKLTNEDFEGYIKKLQSFVFGHLKRIGIDLDYESSVGEQSPAIASIHRTNRFTGHMMSMRLELTCRQELRMEQRIEMILTHAIRDMIDIERCDDIEAAYIGAYSVLLHEIGHHIDWTQLGEVGSAVKQIDEAAIDASLAKEVLCDRMGFLLSKKIPTRDHSAERQELYFQSLTGLLVGFLVRLNKGLYEGNEQAVVHSFSRMLLSFESAHKMKCLSEDTRSAITQAIGHIQQLREDYADQAELKPEQLQKGDEAMRRLYRTLSYEDILGMSWDENEPDETEDPDEENEEEGDEDEE